MKKRRADEVVLESAALGSIELARALIMEGRVLLADRKLLHPGEMVDPSKPIRVLGLLDPYASRGAHKLKRALEVFSIDLEDSVCMDIGSSTGGFTDVMLRAGAKRVYAIDVGYNLLDWRIRSNERVVVMERTNARFLERDMFPENVAFGATDVSFISLKQILPAAFRVLGRGGRFVALIKPQFEAAREEVEAGGLVRDPNVHRAVLEGITDFVADETKWRVNGLDHSPIRGTEGNIEFLIDLVEKDNEDIEPHHWSIEDTIEKAYYKFIKSGR